ncbi:MAG: DUF1439 domain-containing protein [Halorhodospira halophila]|uniref:DUF1439 domain-containing protein n=1 Tax=Halorhodospira TaxID=85108 RepID=UPI001913A4D3|nr:DUF1439 domain-containing protein [Halorhodospira halophila]MCG5533188.1 DUF1439 domain-containing protein [Halorhodospira sp. 9621]MCG5536970.1 DUF1439 domain-containing protein [Halorhodospira sp. 9622]MCG5542270.1 DUF1439 domain-containing protein [Halorhodospira sp. 9628]MCC3750388.1 DUF1439 domain-containing protein [Halorhodospira halophila]MCG5527860.1 DUF1439 domain-containing protein [Halorhodospira halophila]
MNRRRSLSGALCRMLFVLALPVLSGCAQLVSYSVEQDEVQAHLDTRLEALRDVRLQSPLAAFDFSVRTADVTLGPEEAPDRIQLDILGRAGVDLLMGQESAGVALRLRGLPDYDHEAGAVYVRELELVTSRVESRWFNGEVTELVDPVVGLVGEHLERTPVYEIERDSATGRVLGRVPAEVRVEPGRLVLRPR